MMTAAPQQQEPLLIIYIIGYFFNSRILYYSKVHFQEIKHYRG